MKKITSLITTSILLLTVTLVPIQANAKDTTISSGETVTCEIDNNSSQSYTVKSLSDGDMKVIIDKGYQGGDYCYIRVVDKNNKDIMPYYSDNSYTKYTNGKSGSLSQETSYFYHIPKGEYTIVLTTDAPSYFARPVKTTVFLCEKINTTIRSGEPIYDSVAWNSPKGYTITSSNEGDMTIEMQKNGGTIYVDVTDSTGNSIAPYEYTEKNCDRNKNGYYYLKSDYTDGIFTYHIKKGTYNVSMSTSGELCSLTSTITVPSDNTISNSEISVIANGTTISFDQPPIIIDGRTLVPLRAIFEALGATVDWYSETATVVSQRGNTNIKMTIGSNLMQKNNEDITLDVPAQLINDRTLVPVRAIAEAFGCNVDWNGETQTVTITE